MMYALPHQETTLGQTTRKAKPLETIWELTDDLLDHHRTDPPRGHPADAAEARRPARIDWRRERDRTGSSSASAQAASGTSCNASATTARSHRWFQRRCRNGVFERIRAELVRECDNLGGRRKWQACRRDAGQGPEWGGKRRAGTPPIAARWGPRRASWSMATAARSAAVIAGANVPEQTQLKCETIRADRRRAPRPRRGRAAPGPDAGYDNAPTREVVEGHGYVGHTRPAREGLRPKRRPGRRKARRWVVEIV